jgi:O-antigen/teichoic acid export membrane protein
VAGADAPTAAEFDRMAREATIRFSGLAFDKLLGYLFLLLVSKTYGSKAFDVYLFGVYVVEISLAVAELGLERAAVRAVAFSRARGRPAEIKGVVATALALVIPPGLVAAAVLFGLADQIGVWLGRPDAGPFLRAAALAVPASLAADAFFWSAEGLGKQRYMTVVRMVVEPVVKVGLTAVLFGLFGDATAAVDLGHAYTVSILVSALLGAAMYRRLVASRIPGRPAERHAAALLRVSMPLWGSAVLVRLLARADVVLLFALAPATTATLYMAALSTALLTTMIARSFEAACRPLLASAIALGRPDELRAQYERVSRLVLTLCLPACVVLLLFPELVLAVIGEQFRPVAPAMAVLTAGTLVDYLYGPSASALTMAGITRVPFANSLAAGAVALLLDILLIPRLGALGAAVAQCASMITLGALNAGAARRRLGVAGVGGRHWKVGAAGAAAAAAGWAAAGVGPANKYAALAAVVVASGSAYVAALWGLGVEPEDRALVRTVLTRGAPEAVGGAGPEGRR